MRRETTSFCLGFLGILSAALVTLLSSAPASARDCCPIGTASVVCTCKGGYGEADPIFPTNPPSPPPPPAHGNDPVPPPAPPAHGNDPVPPPAPPKKDLEAKLGVQFTFVNADDCAKKIAGISSATVDLPDDMTAEAYCSKLFPAGTKVPPLTMILPGHFHFADEKACLADTDLSAAGAETVFPNQETAEAYCQSLFAPPADPGKTGSGHAVGDVDLTGGGTCAAGTYGFAAIFKKEGPNTYTVPAAGGGPIVWTLVIPSVGSDGSFTTTLWGSQVTGNCSHGKISITGGPGPMSGSYGNSGTIKYVVSYTNEVVQTTTSDHIMFLHLDSNAPYHDFLSNGPQ